MERTNQVAIDIHKGSVVVELAAVVGGSENCHQFSLPEELVPFLNHLVGSANQVNVKFRQNIFHHILAESITHSSLALPPSCNIGVGVRPEDIADESLIRNLNRSLDVDQVFEVVEVRRESSMHTQNLLIN